ncbi:glycoside hydrolase family 9 protein [Amycolatopsis sp. NPDC059657]|uniref:glycoside hydrolase family 9 protein n=1 Tax=Amycolatopsis sp. NPDC059657 TaxID=3346899 RepID=UPI00366D3107
MLLAGFATDAHADQYERVLNGTFSVKTPWWSSGNTPSTVDSGRLCADIPAGTVNPWESMIGQNDIPLEAGQPYTLRFTASASRDVTIRAALGLAAPPNTTSFTKTAALTSTPKMFEFTGPAAVSTIHGQVGFQAGGATQPYRLCLDDVSLTGGVIPPGGGRTFGSPVRVNQVGYAVSGPKQASIVDAAKAPVRWRLLDSTGTAVEEGMTQVRGDDAMSGDHVHLADFSGFREAGTGYTVAVGDAVSQPFDIAENPYDALRRDSLKYFYYHRSGIEIVGGAYARPAGHLGVAPNKGDIQVPCRPGTCDYVLDVRGGWYDAGDQGKYVVNGALAAWQLMDSYERSLSTGDFEGLRDVLGEARWELEFLLRMQVPDGKPLAGMAHHKIHDEAWTPLPTQPQNDPQLRYLHPPSTAATLNLAAAGAQCARIWAIWDWAFAKRCLSVAEKAWNAAVAHPDLYAPREDNVGGGPYDDTTVTDEFAWAGAELYAITGKRSYLDRVTAKLTADGFSWKDTGGLADITMVRLPFRFPADRVRAARDRVLNVAGGYVRDLDAQGYPNPYLPSDGQYAWGSNSATTNNAMIIATAYDLTRRTGYRDAVLKSMDYLLGRNALNQSFITGYGEQASHNQHHRIFAHELDPKLPNPPPGSLAGGPNSALADPVAQQNLPGCPPAKCYLDEIGSYSTNEVAINWNSSLAWITAFASSEVVSGTAGSNRPKPSRPLAASAASPLDLTSGFYVNTNSLPATWARDHAGDSRAARIQSSIGARPIARWFGNDSDIGGTVASYTGAADANDKLPVLVAYNLPGRDACGGESGGGAGSVSAYKTWISSFAAGVGSKPAIVVIEPDALGDFSCMTSGAIADRLAMLTYATQMFQQKAPNTFAYLDGGNAGWVDAPTMASRLESAGVHNVRGFSVNVSNYYPTSQSISYANSVNSSLGGGARFVVDTSRNGKGSSGEWCNPAGRQLGVPPQIGGGAELLLWVKTPGVSDGKCGIAPTVPAGQFSPDLAIRLIDGT